MDKSAKIWMVVAIVLFLVILGMTYLLFALPPLETTTPVSTSTPQQPVTAPVTTVPDPNAPLSERVIVTTPLPNTSVGATFVVKGNAPGNWFFEADFPIQVRDKDGNVIARTFASALGEWMTTEQVGFSSTIIVEGGYKGPATLILVKNNPSGLPEHDDAVEIPITIQ
ncbi:MAG: hypothetical protein KBD06_05445 [Candidatus Pacebacteria bacterium]|nr:hypothetical protein [Candidatus Paceibacterota bacterium]